MNKIIIFLFCLLIFTIGFFPAKDTDFGWHYRCGNQFLTSGKLCLKNEFSYYLANYQAYNPSFLYDISLAFLYKHGGLLTISIMGALVLTISAILFYFLIRPVVWINFLSFLIMFFLSYPVFSLGLRSQVLTYLFFLLLLFLLTQKERKLLLLMPLIFFIWVNTHIGFFIGLIVLGLYAIASIRKPIFFNLILIFVFSFLATLINPFGINVYREILNHALSPLNKMIAEWVEPSTWHIMLIIFLTLLSLFLSIKNKSLNFFKILLLIFFCLLALKARRNVPFFYIAFFYSFDFSRFFPERNRVINHIFFIFTPVLISTIIFYDIVFVPKTIQFDSSWSTYCESGTGVSFYPCEALKQYLQLSGNVYANYEWGGFLIWQKPNIKVFVDGRMPAWKDKNGRSPYQVYLEIIQTKDGWNEKLHSLKTDYIFIANGTFLDLLLQKGSEKYHWREVYRDNLAVIYQNIM